MSSEIDSCVAAGQQAESVQLSTDLCRLRRKMYLVKGNIPRRKLTCCLLITDTIGWAGSPRELSQLVKAITNLSEQVSHQTDTNRMGPSVRRDILQRLSILWKSPPAFDQTIFHLPPSIQPLGDAHGRSRFFICLQHGRVPSPSLLIPRRQHHGEGL